jgi:hypothetical protein
MKKLLLLLSLFFVVLAWGMQEKKALIRACKKGNLVRVKELVEAGVNLEERDKQGNTVLMEACYEGYLDVVKCLIGKGAMLNAKNQAGEICLDWACFRGDYNFSTIKYLVECGVDVKRVHEETKTNALHRTCRWASFDLGQSNSIVYLLDRGVDFNTQDNLNKTFYDYLIASRRHQLRIKLSTLNSNHLTCLSHRYDKSSTVFLMYLGHKYDKNSTVNALLTDVIGEITNKYTHVILSPLQAKIWQPVGEEAVKQHNALYNLQHDVSDSEKNLKRIVCLWSPDEQQKVSEKLLALGM